MPQTNDGSNLFDDEASEDEYDEEDDFLARPFKPRPDPWRQPKYAPDTCTVCGAPIAQPRTGRPRLTCSDRCRQRRCRLGQGWRSWEKECEAERRKLIRFVDRTVADFERRFGPPPAHLPESYQLIAFRLYRKHPRAYRTCAECRRPFIPNVLGPAAIYCSAACRARVERQRRKKRRHGGHTEPRPYTRDEKALIAYRHSRGLPILACRECGRFFLHYWPGRTPKYCSNRCRDRAWRHRRRPRYRTCHHCGRRYRVGRGRHTVQKYCSHTCYDAAYRRRLADS